MCRGWEDQASEQSSWQEGWRFQGSGSVPNLTQDALSDQKVGGALHLQAEGSWQLRGLGVGVLFNV